MSDNPSTDLTTTEPKRVIGRPWPKGVSGNPGGGVGRARNNLNLDTIKGMQQAFSRGGQRAIDKVMRTQPQTFLKLLVLLVPREMKVEHTGGVKAMTDEQLEAGIEAITAMLEGKLPQVPGDDAKVVEGVVEPAKPKRKRRKTDGEMVTSMGKADDVVDS
jgi:hypothetical protein